MKEEEGRGKTPRGGERGGGESEGGAKSRVRNISSRNVFNERIDVEMPNHFLLGGPSIGEKQA
jgi:hypothetical protein